jgi:hypothetical protein
MSNYHFDKKFTLTAHTLELQLKAFREMMQKRDEASKQAWIDTVPAISEAEAEERLATLRDKWHRPQGGK